LLLRELDRRSGLASCFARWLERVATGIGYNRVRQLTFRPAHELVEQLGELGFVCQVERGRRLPWSAANVLIVARLDDTTAHTTALADPLDRGPGAAET